VKKIKKIIFPLTELPFSNIIHIVWGRRHKITIFEGGEHGEETDDKGGRFVGYMADKHEISRKRWRRSSTIIVAWHKRKPRRLALSFFPVSEDGPF